MNYDDKVGRMKAFGSGRVEERDYYPNYEGRAPYRLACLDIQVRNPDVPAMASRLAELSIEVCGYMTVNVYVELGMDYCHLSCSVHRPLAEHEIDESRMPRQELAEACS